MQNVATLTIKCLETHNVQYIFGVPGEENLDILQALKDSTIQLIVTRNEQSAVFMAATYGRLTGSVGVALATLGPGATNMMTGVAYAQLGGMPVMVITGQKPIKTSKQGRFQVIDVVAMMKPVTKFTTSIIDASRVASTISYSINLAEEEKPGVVHIELPEDIAGEDASQYQPLQIAAIRRPVPDEKAITQLITMIQQSRTPLILIGSGANRKRITKYLTKLITEYNIPFFCSQMGKGVVDERLPQYIGTAALTSGDHIHEMIGESDLIIAIGYDSIEKPTHVIEQGKTQVIHIGFSSAQINELYCPTLQVVGDIGNTLWQLHTHTIDTSSRDHDHIYQLNTTIQQQLSQTPQSTGVMQPLHLIHKLRGLLPQDAIISLDNGLYKVRFARNYTCYHPNTLLLDNALATMGAGYSAGIVAKLLYPETQVVCIVGDGGIMMNMGDLHTAIALDIDMTVIILNDSAYGMIKRKQHTMGLDDYGLDLTNPDFVSLAQSFGAHGYRVESLDQFDSIWTKSQAQSGLKIIEIVCEYPKDFT